MPTLHLSYCESMPATPRIEAFGSAIRGRGTNDAMNSDRESAIEMLFSADPDVRDLLIKDSPDRAEWIRVRSEFEDAINSFMLVGGHGVEPQRGNISTVKRLGGRSRNFDFEGSFESTSGVVTSLKIELKRGESIYDQPQFLQLYARDGNVVTRHVSSYAEWFYDRYLAEVSRLAGTSLPSKQDYLQRCCGTDYKAFPHTKVLYDRLKADDDRVSKALKEIAFTSIDSYLAKLEQTPSVVDMTSLQERLNEQLGKLFVSWDSHKREFAVEVFSKNAMTLDGKVSFKTRPSGERSKLVVMNRAHHPIEALLRWKNRSCLLGPAWQISLKSN